MNGTTTRRETTFLKIALKFYISASMYPTSRIFFVQYHFDLVQAVKMLPPARNRVRIPRSFESSLFSASPGVDGDPDPERAGLAVVRGVDRESKMGASAFLRHPPAISFDQDLDLFWPSLTFSGFQEAHFRRTVSLPVIVAPVEVHEGAVVVPPGPDEVPGAALFGPVVVPVEGAEGHPVVVEEALKVGTIVPVRHAQGKVHL